MECYKCKGLMTVDTYPSAPRKICAWRCISCGELIDPTIIKNKIINRNRRVPEGGNGKRKLALGTFGRRVVTQTI